MNDVQCKREENEINVNVVKAKKFSNLYTFIYSLTGIHNCVKARVLPAQFLLLCNIF